MEGRDYGGVLAVLAQVNRSHASAYVLAGRLAGGNQGGVYLLSAPDGGLAVLKWSDDPGWAGQVRRAASAVERARRGGYPTPAWLVAGTTADGCPYHVQRFVPGTPIADLEIGSVELLLDLVERQAGLDPDPGRDWSAHVAASVFEDVEGVGRWLRGQGVDCVAIVDAYAKLCAPYRAESLPGGDLVHGDLSTRNVLVTVGRVSGVVDIEALGSGTRVVDLAALLREGYLWRGDPRALRRLRRAAEAIAGPAVLAVCVAASVLGVLGFELRRRSPHARAALGGALRLADELSRPL